MNLHLNRNIMAGMGIPLLTFRRLICLSVMSSTAAMTYTANPDS